MKIGIDAKWFFSGPPSGKVVIRQLLKEILVDRYSSEEFYVFLNKSDENFEFPYARKNVKLVYVKTFNNLITNAVILPKLFKKLKLDVILFQNFGTFYKINSIVYIHDVLYLDYPQYYSWKERLYLSLLKPLASSANKIVTISKTEKKRIISHKLTKNKLQYVYHGVNSKFKPLLEHDRAEIDLLKEKYGLPDQFILYLGRLNIRKNIGNLISAMQFIDIPLVIAGSHDHKNEDLDIKIEALRLKEKIKFTGYLEEDELPLIYALATLFCFPSYAEGFGLPPLEAMASGTPVVVSDRTSLPEVCGDAALYIDPDKPNDIAKKINSLLASKEMINLFSRKGINQSKKFSWKKSAENLMNIIKMNHDR